MERLDGAVRRALRSAGVPDAGALARLVAAWPACVGAPVARHAWPLRLARDGTLRVACSSSTWACELDRMAPEILERLRSELGAAAPAALRFAPGPVPAPGPDDPAAGGRAASPPPSPGPAARAEAERLTAGIEDPELRAMAARAIAASLADRGGDRAF